MAMTPFAGPENTWISSHRNRSFLTALRKKSHRKDRKAARVPMLKILGELHKD
jgi:hypothetical protein